MARKDLGGLAALAGLAYMASRDKAAKGDVPVEDAKPTATGFMNEKEPGWDSKGSEYGTEKEPGWDSGTAPSRPAASRPTASRTASSDKPASSKVSAIAGDLMSEKEPGWDKKAAKKETYRDLSGKVREKAPDTSAEDAAARREKIGSALSSAASSVGDFVSGLGKREEKHGTYVKDGKVVRYAKGGMAKAKAPAASVKGWGMARGARKAKTY